MIIRSLTHPNKYESLTIGFEEPIRKVVFDNNEHQAFVLLESEPYIYRIFIKKLIDTYLDANFKIDEMILRLDLDHKRDGNKMDKTPIDDILVIKAK